MKRKDYEKPSMKVVILKQRAKLLQASGGGDFGTPNYVPGSNPFGS